MPVGSSHLPPGAGPQRDVFDIGIVSVSDDAPTVKRAVGLEPSEEEDAAASTQGDGDPGEEREGEEPPPADGHDDPNAAAPDADPDAAPDADPDAAPDADPDAAPDADPDTEADAAAEATRQAAEKGEADEPPVAGETAKERRAREGRNRGRYQKRINGLTGQLANARQHIDTLTTRLDRLERGERPAPRRDAAPPAEEAPAAFTFPSFEDWQAQKDHAEKTYEDYIDARADAKYDHRQAAERARAAREDATREIQELVAANQARIDEFRAVHADDFDRILKDSTSPMTEVMNRALMTSSVGPAIAQFLAGDVAEATRIATLHPLDQPAAVARLERHPSVVALVADVWPDAAPSVPAGPSAGTPPAPGRGARPRKHAPAPPPPPLRPRRGPATGDRDLADFAATENADDYVKMRDRQLRAGQR